MENYFKISIAGMERLLPKVMVTNDLAIASFNINGDIELIKHTAAKLAEKMPQVDILVTSESKGIPLTYEISALLGKKNYIVARKSAKAYMIKPIINESDLYIDKNDTDAIAGKNVCIIDDIISSGETLRKLENIINKAGGNVVAKCFILAEGNSADRDDIIFLEKLPVFEIH